jgi:hypothetical protein
MTAEMVAVELDQANEGQLTLDELSRMGTLIGSVIDDVRAGTEYPGFMATYDEATNTATWTNTRGSLEAKATVKDGVSAFTISQKLTDEVGYNVQTTAVALTATEARMTKSLVRDTGLNMEQPTTGPLDRTAYDTTLENLVAIKTTGAEDAPAQPERRRLLPFGWMRVLIGR